MKELIKKLIEEGYLEDKKIIEAFKKIDRADFLPDHLHNEAELNTALPIGYAQTISQPLTVAFMLELLEPQAGDKILDIGSGSGWQTALLAQITGEKGKIFGIEIIPELKEFGEKNVEKYNFISQGRVKFFCKNGAEGIPEEAPFDRIIVAAAAREVPYALLNQLRIGGILVIPIEDPSDIGGQGIVVIKKIGEDKFKRRFFPGFVFVPFVEPME